MMLAAELMQLEIAISVSGGSLPPKAKGLMVSNMEDKEFLLEHYQQEFWKYQTKELSRNYRLLTLSAIKTGVLVGVITGVITAVVVFKILLD